MILFVSLFLANCGAGGILTMDDRWCDAHPIAPASRCGHRAIPETNLWYRAPRDEPQMMSGSPDSERDIPAQAIVIPDPTE